MCDANNNSDPSKPAESFRADYERRIADMPLTELELLIAGINEIFAAAEQPRCPVTLTDENGNAAVYDLSCQLTHEGQEYALLFPVEDNGAKFEIRRVLQAADGSLRFDAVDPQTFDILLDLFKALYSES